MRLEHSFTVPVGIDDAWRVLLDIELIAPCMPGAAIDSVDGDDFTGTVKVKLGPIGLTYKGRASFVEKDETAHRAVIDARGRDSRGSGTANAKVTATLTESRGSTKVDVITDLDITGKPAQFGRGVMVDVGNKLIGQFADCLAGKLTDGAMTDASASPRSESPTPSMETAVSDETPTTPRPRPRPRRKATGDSDTAAELAKAGTATSAEATARPVKAATGKAATGKAAPGKAAPGKAAPGKAAAVKAAPGKADAPDAHPSEAASGAVAAANATAAASASVSAPDAAAGAAKPAVPPAQAQPTATERAGTAADTEEKVAPVTALPSRPAAQPRRTVDDVEPINLIESAGPALAKRLLPILALVILLILIVRRRRH
ncbi:MAG: SRPBCC family protein [Actinomycetota bacterium]|nr:SRPBCC family protein [Actinomycetota bacterium]